MTEYNGDAISESEWFEAERQHMEDQPEGDFNFMLPEGKVICIDCWELIPKSSKKCPECGIKF